MSSMERHNWYLSNAICSIPSERTIDQSTRSPLDDSKSPPYDCLLNGTRSPWRMGPCKMAHKVVPAAGYRHLYVCFMSDGDVPNPRLIPVTWPHVGQMAPIWGCSMVPMWRQEYEQCWRYSIGTDFKVAAGLDEEEQLRYSVLVVSMYKYQCYSWKWYLKKCDGLIRYNSIIKKGYDLRVRNVFYMINIMLLNLSIAFWRQD